MSLELKGVTVRFRRFEALRRVELSIPAGTRVAVVGESGAGKSTLLNTAAGLVSPSEGKVRVFGLAPGSKALLARVGFVFQSDALFPHLSIRENVMFPLRARDWSRSDALRRVEELLDRAEIADQADKRPEQLSGGQRQRASIARALACSPDLLLLDEPFANLDGPLRRRVREFVIGERQSSAQATILVTHDPEEAMAFGERLIVLKEGKVVADGRPRDLYWRPADPYVAELLGECNVLEGVLDGATLILPNLAELNEEDFRRYDATVPARAEVFIRPEAFRVAINQLSRSSGAASIPAKVAKVRDMGRFLALTVELEGVPSGLRVNILALNGSAVQAGSVVTLSPITSQMHLRLLDRAE